jgi:hypothetical protein
MRLPLFVILTFLLLLPFASSLESGTILSAEPDTEYKCVYVNLPQDLGIASISQDSETVIEVDKSSSPWSDMTYNKVVMSPGVLNRNPVCFSYSGKKEGDFSFYSISLSSVGLGVSNSISGGLCVSHYADVDTGFDMSNKTDVCRLLSENADIIDLSFGEEIIQAKLGEVITKTLYVTSYANLRIKLSMVTNLQNDFEETFVTTSQSKPTVTKTFKLKAPEREGDFETAVLAQVDGCAIQACKKIKHASISVKQDEKEGFSVAVIPKNINLKTSSEVLFRVVINNYEETQNFIIKAASEPSLVIEPEAQDLSIDKGKEKVAVFSVTPGSDALYELEFTVGTEETEKAVTAYLSVGELLTDALRYAEAAESTIANEDIKEEMRKARAAYEESYNTSSYGNELDDLEDFVNTIDELKDSEANGNGPVQPAQGAGFDWILVAIPLVVIAAVALLLVAFKKAKTTASGGDYASYPGYYRGGGHE